MLDRRIGEPALECSSPASDPAGAIDEIREYWNENIHDLEASKQPIGSKEFFEEIEGYHFEKFEYLPRIVGFNAYKGKRLLEVGCGLGIDLIRFAKGGAIVTGIDISEKTIELARKNFEIHGIDCDLRPMNGEHLQFSDSSFDVVYSLGVLGYTRDAMQMIHEIHRVLKRGGEAILTMYHRNSWLFFLPMLLGRKIYREDAPIFKTYSITEFRQMLLSFSTAEIFVERFPIRNPLLRGFKATLFNNLFVPAFNLIPRVIVRSFGAHIIAKAIK
ncbi:MAG: class I SAM-dependent methyltransferase [Thermodesulfobacteriota bacterium]